MIYLKIKVKGLPPDEWARPRVADIETGAIYADVDCGDGDCERNGLKGNWHTTSRDGEPSMPLKRSVTLEVSDE